MVCLDSMFTGEHPKCWNNTPCGLDEDVAEQTLWSNCDRNSIFNGFNSFMIAVLANACWPEECANQREIVQRTPLVPHQGYTLDCGVHALIHFANLTLHTDAYLAALAPDRQLYFDEGYVHQTRQQLLHWSTEVVNGFDVGLKEFYQGLRRFGDHFKVQAVRMDGDLAVQQKSPATAPISKASLVRNARLPDLRILRL